MFDAFLKVDGIPGESQDSKHTSWIEILSYSWGVAQRATGSSSSGGARSGGARRLPGLHDREDVGQGLPEAAG